MKKFYIYLILIFSMCFLIGAILPESDILKTEYKIELINSDSLRVKSLLTGNLETIKSDNLIEWIKNDNL